MAKNFRGKNLANVLLLVLAIPILIRAWSNGPIPAVTGGFGEPTCQSGCHTGMALNGDPAGGVTISAPASYSSGATIPITVTVSHPNQRRWGFELSVRTLSGEQAGGLIPTDGFTQVVSQAGIQYIEHTLAGSRMGTTGGVSFNFSWQAPDVSAGPVVFHVAANAANGNYDHTGDRIYTNSLTVPPAGTLVFSNNYYFPHLAVGGGWQTTLTYINYSPQIVTCETSFFSDSGAPLSVSFGGGAAASARADTLPPGGGLHPESTADLGAPVATGWARARCSGPIQASLLFRLYVDGKPAAEAGLNAMTAPATKFVTFSDQNTGVAYANPSTEPAQITCTAISTAGERLASRTLTLLPGEHGAVNMGPFLGLGSFQGSIQVLSTVPIVSLSLNAEAFPAFSALPPGQLDDSTPLATGITGDNPPPPPPGGGGY